MLKPEWGAAWLETASPGAFPPHDVLHERRLEVCSRLDDEAEGRDRAADPERTEGQEAHQGPNLVH